MPSTLSTQKRARLAQAPALMPIWTSLPNDLVLDIGDHLLAYNDIDAFMAFRAVCHEWHSITKDDPAKATMKACDGNPITHFEPTRWVLLNRRDDLITLVNIDTGRFLCKRIPLLCRFFFVGATTGGIILLGESVEPHRALVLNPFTGSMAHFKVEIPCEGVRAVAITTKPSLTVFISTENGKIMWADQSMETFKHFCTPYPNKTTCMTSFGGNVYAIDLYGSIYMSTSTITTGGEPSQQSGMDISMAAISPSLDTSAKGLVRKRYYLVESMGDLLLVTKPSGFTVNQPMVRRVNSETQMMEPISSIGSRALFVSHSRCLSIDADKFPSIQGGCIHFLDPIVNQGRYAVVNRTIVHVTDNVVKFDGDWGFVRPVTLAQVLMDYCRCIHYSELYEIMASKWDTDLSDGDDSESDESSSEESSSSELGDEGSSSSELDDDEPCPSQKLMME